MPPDRPIPGSTGDRLTRAKADLAIARAPLPEGAFYEDLCFHAQQAAEKALKAVYQHYGWTFRYTHDLDELINGLIQKGLNSCRGGECGCFDQFRMGGKVPQSQRTSNRKRL